MDILIPDSWLRDFLKTSATPKQIGKYLSLSGPSVEKIEKDNGDFIYHIEVTTNRPDTASVFGVAREASAILPRFGIEASLKEMKLDPSIKFSRQVNYLDVQVDSHLCPRFTAVLIKNVKIAPSPPWLQRRLLKVGVRPINNVVDISNYIMYEIGQPVHTFDYDKISGTKMILRKSKKGEKITTLDGKTHTLPGKDIVIEDGKGRLIDLAGIMGGQNSQIDEKSKNILLFVQTYNPSPIRKTSMFLPQRTDAAMLFEKGLDPENVTLGIDIGLGLFKKLTDGTVENEILDIYHSPYKARKLVTTNEFVEKILGINIKNEEISQILKSLGFEATWINRRIKIAIPSWRSNDILVPEDIVEEIARLYGYHKFPSELMPGKIPDQPPDPPFIFEDKLKNLLKGYGGYEVYTLSLTTKDGVAVNALRLKNPLGSETEFLRTSLRPSLIAAVRQNLGGEEKFHFFEIANVYLPRKNDLPHEKTVLAGIFYNYPYREAKGVVEALLEELKIKPVFWVEDKNGFLPSQHLAIKTGKNQVGELGVLEENFIYYEFDVEILRSLHKDFGKFKPLPKYPAQIEDLTLTFPLKTRIGDVLHLISSIQSLVSRIELVDIFKDSYTFRIWYQHPSKTLTDKEVEKIRNKILFLVKTKFGGVPKG